MVNFVGAILFYILAHLSTGFIATVAGFGYLINAWLGVFNMLPLWVLDGRKVLAWNKIVYGIILGAGLIIMNFGYIIP